MNTNLEKYCLNVCCRDKYPHVCEIRRYEFAILRSIPKTTYFALKALIIANGGAMYYASSNQWGFTIPHQAYDKIVNWITGNDLQIHTLLDHLDQVRNFFRVPKKEIGKYCFVDLPPREKWQYFDSATRSWIDFDTLSEFGMKGGLTRAGTVMKCSEKGETEYYKVSDSGTKIYLLETKRAALNLAAQYFSEKKAYWVEHKQAWVIPLRTLGIMPEDIFYALVRMRPFREVAEGLLVFAKTDFALIKEFLKIINITLVKCSRLIELPGDMSKARGTPLLRLEDIDKARISTIKSLIEDLGASVIENADTLSIAGRADKFKIAFVDSDATRFHDETFFVPVSKLNEVSVFYDCARLLAIRLGRKNLSIDKLLAIHWNIISDADAQFVVKTFIKNINDPEFSSQMLSRSDKIQAIRKWYEDCLDGTDFNSQEGLMLYDLLRKVSQVLSLF